MNCPSSQEVVRFFDRGVVGERAEELDQHFATCHACDGVRRDLEKAAAEVANVNDAYRSPLRRARILAAVAETVAVPKPRRHLPNWRWLLGAGTSTALAATLLIGVMTPDSGTIERGFQAREAGGQPVAAWVGFDLFRWDGSGERPQPVASTIQTSDFLLFAYTNLDPRRFSWLALVGLDSAGEVHWLQRSPEHHGVFRIATRVSRREIPEAVRPDFAVGPLRLAAVFSTQPLPAPVVESWLRAGAQEGDWASTQVVDAVLMDLTVAP